jgi:hypothetical protein
VKHLFLIIAVVLVLIWIFARVALAITSLALHLLWIVAVIAVVIWLIRRFTARS